MQTDARRDRKLPFDTAAALPLIQALAGLHDSVILLDPQGRVVWMTAHLGERCGGAERFVGKCWSELLADGTAGRRLAQALCTTGRLSREPVELVGVDGRAIQATVSAARLGSEVDACPVVAILRIGGERLEHELEANLATARSFLDTCPDGVVVVDASRFIAYANPAIEDVIGYRPDELVDRPLALFVGGDQDLERIAAALREENPVRNQDLEVRRSDGSAVCVSVSASLLRVPDGRSVGAVAYLRDVTQRRRDEDALARKNSELEHYVHAVSHDLRSPLVSLLGFSRLLRDDYGARLDAKGLHFLERVEQAGRTMESLIADLLELSRIGRSGHARSRVNPRGVLLQLHAELKPRLDAQSVSLVIPEDLPGVVCDRTRLYQLFSNLVGNALDHMGNGRQGRIEVEVNEEFDHHLIAVRDDGRGIAPEHHERIFEAFQSLGPRRDGSRGTGMGLAIVRKIAEAQGGRAWVESEPGRGACFKVLLPNA
ncbi:MAG TPA: ATP-binding protein [Myxococcota bacterium]|nr:ATP-binding protein [Myxococcota bacterium]